MRFFKDWYMVIIPVVAFLLMMFALTHSGEKTRISVPVEFCKAQSTGRKKTEDIPIQTCAAYDKNMACTVPLTTWSTETRSETRVTCDFVEWR